MSRQCSGNKLWYICSQGLFQGCCSINPCHVGGVCPDDDDVVAAFSTKDRTGTPTKPVSTNESTLKTSTATTSHLETTSTGGATIASTTSTSTTSISTTTADNVSADAETGDTTPVGAIVGGVIGAITFLILLAIALFFIYRRLKKRGTAFATDDQTTMEQAMHLPSKKEKPETSSLLAPTDYSPSGITPISPTSTAAELDAYHLCPPQCPYTLFTHPNASNPELSNTEVYSHRAELAAQPSRELINVPPHRRHQPPTLATLAQDQVDPTLANLPPVITADGVVLTANFDPSASKPGTIFAHGTSNSHAMSFMEYDAARRSIQSAHRPEWVDNPGEGKADKLKGEKSPSEIFNNNKL